MIPMSESGSSKKRPSLLPAFLMAVVAVVSPLNAVAVGPIPSPSSVVSITPEHQGHFASIVDESGAMISVWTITGSIYAQKIDSSGVAQWDEGGVAIGTVVGNGGPTLCSDGAGGAIIAWDGSREIFGIERGPDAFAQRVSSSGQKLWPENKRIVSVGDALRPKQSNVKVLADGAGGAFFVWISGNVALDSQRLNANGESQWDISGVTFAYGQDLKLTSLVTDGADGFIVLSLVHNVGSDNSPIRAHRVIGDGSLQWSSEGVLISPSGGAFLPAIMADENGGAIIAWLTNGKDIFAHRIDSAGVLGWAAGGVAICEDSHTQEPPKITSDGNGGAIIAWADNRNHIQNSTYWTYDIFAQRIDNSGAVRWDDSGTSVCTARHSQFMGNIVSDGSGGAIVLWNDTREFFQPTGLGVHMKYDVYGQRLDESGATLWADDGLPISSGAENQMVVNAFGNGSGEAGVVWRDNRETNRGLYYSFVNSDGRAPSVATANGWEFYD